MAKQLFPEKIDLIGYSENLRKYYRHWYRSALASAQYCSDRGNMAGYKHYVDNAARYKRIIDTFEITEEETIKTDL